MSGVSRHSRGREVPSLWSRERAVMPEQPRRESTGADATGRRDVDRYGQGVDHRARAAPTSSTTSSTTSGSSSSSARASRACLRWRASGTASLPRLAERPHPRGARSGDGRTHDADAHADRPLSSPGARPGARFEQGGGARGRGSEIELDRAILDNLDEPFVHTLRNAVDHGIEAPAEREACRSRGPARCDLGDARPRHGARRDRR